jgi:hypothetical protein
MPGAETMGRPKKGAKTAEAKSPNDRVAVIHLKGSPEYVAFVDALNRKTHIPKAAIFRLALAEWCERNGHGTPPEL